MIMFMHLKQVNGVFRFIRTTLFDLESRSKNRVAHGKPMQVAVRLAIGRSVPSCCGVASWVKWSSHRLHFALGKGLHLRSPLMEIHWWSLVLTLVEEMQVWMLFICCHTTPKQNWYYTTFCTWVTFISNFQPFPSFLLVCFSFEVPQTCTTCTLLLCPTERFWLMEAAVFCLQPWQEPWRSRAGPVILRLPETFSICLSLFVNIATHIYIYISIVCIFIWKWNFENIYVFVPVGAWQFEEGIPKRIMELIVLFYKDDLLKVFDFFAATTLLYLLGGGVGSVLRCNREMFELWFYLTFMFVEMQNLMPTYRVKGNLISEWVPQTSAGPRDIPWCKACILIREAR